MREVTKRDWLLCSMLKCGYLDLEMLDDIKYDWGDILKQIDYPDEEVTFNDLIGGAFELGACNIAETVENRINDLKVTQMERKLDEDEKQELEDLRSLNPAQDIQGYFNCLDARIWFADNEDIYRKYVPEALESFEDNTGLTFVS